MIEFLKKIPGLYNVLVKLYRIINVKLYKSVNSSVEFESFQLSGYRNTFFGYYDVTPFNPYNNNLLLLHANNANSNVKPNVIFSSDIVLFDKKLKTYKIIDKTFSWNWQQGARLQWLNEREIIYNYYDNEDRRLYGKIVDIKNSTTTILPVSINAVYKRDYVLTLDYVSLSKFSEYGYRGISETNTIDGILKYDFEGNVVSNVLRICEINKKLGSSIIQQLSNLHINHISISVDGSSFVFIYRGQKDKDRVDFLFYYSFINSELKLLNSNNIISHYTWRDQSSLIMWANICGVSGYYEINVENDCSQILLRTNKDGHPNILNNGCMLTDTYPNIHSNQKLYLYDFNKQEEKELLSIYHPVFFSKESRCDLHPSVSENGKCFQIDSRFRGKREILIGSIYEE